MTSGRLLLFEDDFRLATDLAAGLSAEYEVDIAHDVEDAFLLARAGEYVGLVCDLFIDGADSGGGVTLISAIRNGLRGMPPWGRNVPIIAMTGAAPFNGFDALEVASDVGANATVRKPIDVDQLLATLAHHIRVREAAATSD